jgi:hypothetical protein
MNPRRPLMPTRPRAPKPARRLLPFTRLYLVVCLSAASAAASAAATPAEPDILGSWRLDDAATAEVQPVDGARGGGLEGFRAPTISINGIPLPGAGSPEPTTAGSAPDPDVLRCSRLVIEPQGDRIRLTYTGVGAETLEPGRHQGITTRWKGNLLTSSYETTSRRVTQRFELQGDDSLLVTVKLDPRRGQAVTHKRMFHREGAAPTEPAPAHPVNPG